MTPSATTFVDAKEILLIAYALSAVMYTWFLARDFTRRRREQREAGLPITHKAPTRGGITTGFFTNFFDALGVGSYATTTSIFRFWNMVPDEQIPGTMNVGHTLPTVVEAFFFTQLVPIDARTLILLVAAAVAGAWMGASVVVSWPRRAVQIGMGSALFVAAALMLSGLLNLTPAGGAALSLAGWKLGVAISVNFILGALMTLGIGLYAPCMIMMSLLGMSPTAVFPVMTGSCALLMPVASIRFLRSGRYEPRALLGLLVGGIPAVLIAVYVVKSLPVTVMKWLVVAVVVYTATGLLRTAARERAAAASAA